MSTNDGGTGSKKSWDDWSDFEINKAVYENLGLTPDDLDILVESMSIQLVEAMPFMSKAYEGVCIYYGKDYCNNPADMWPIIVANDISIQAPNEYFDEWYSSKLGAKISYCHKNPLRAAAIVFLEMNGVKPNA